MTNQKLLPSTYYRTMNSAVDCSAPENNFKAPPSSSSSSTTSPNPGTALSPSTASVTGSNVSRRQRIRLATLRSEAGNKKSSGSPIDSKVKVSEHCDDEEDLITMPSLASFSIMDHDEGEWSDDDDEGEEESIYDVEAEGSKAQEETLRDCRNEDIAGDEKKEGEKVTNPNTTASSTFCIFEREDTIKEEDGVHDKNHPVYIPKPGGKSEVRRYVVKSAFALESTESERADNGDSQQQHGQRQVEDSNQGQLPVRREHIRMVARRSTPLFLPHEEILQGVLQAKRDKNAADTNLRQPVRSPESEIDQAEQTVAEGNGSTEEMRAVTDAVEEFPAAAVETKSKGEELEQELTVEEQLEPHTEQDEQTTEEHAPVTETAFVNLELPRTTTEMLVYGAPVLDPAKPKYRSLTRHSVAFRPTVAQNSQIILNDEIVRHQIHPVQPCRLSNDEQMEYATAGMPIKQQQPKVLNVTTTTHQVPLPINEYTPRPVGAAATTCSSAADFSQA